MGKPAGFWLNRIKSQGRRRSSAASATPESSVKNDEKTENSENQSELKSKTEGAKSGPESGRKVMIVVDMSAEAKNALQWALSHCVQDEDTIVLLYVIRPPKLQSVGDESSKERASRAYEQIHPLKNLCQLKKPKVKTEIVVVEGEERGRTIVEESRKQVAGLLVIGQKKRSSRWRVILRWRVSGSGNGNGGSLVDYCIHNADCMAIAVRKKSKRLGGYLITTKRHKDFWLLA